MGHNTTQAAPAGVPDNIPTRAEFFAANPFPPDSIFIDEPELRRRLHLSRRTLFNYRTAGKIPCVSLGGRRILFHWPSVEAALLRMQRGGGL